jgi:hypothetical protein
MRRRETCLSLPGLVFAVVAAGCGGSAAVTGSEAPSAAGGNAVLQGALLGGGFAGASSSGMPRALGGGSGYTVTLVGSSLTVEVDEDGRFVLAGLPAGSVSLRIEGPGLGAQVAVSGLQDGQVLTVQLQLTGSTVQVSGTPKCTPSAETFFSGSLDQVAGASLVVGGRPVDASQVKKVWRGEKRVSLADLQAGERVKVWGVLRGDGVVVAEEIAALTKGGTSGETWFTLRGRVDAVGGGSLNALELHANPYPSPAPYHPTLTVAGKVVSTSAETRFKWSSGDVLDPHDIKVGQTASVEGWKKPDGSLRATAVTVDK